MRPFSSLDNYYLDSYTRYIVAPYIVNMVAVGGKHHA